MESKNSSRQKQGQLSSLTYTTNRYTARTGRAFCAPTLDTLARGVAFSLFALAVAPFILTTPVHATDDNTVSITVNPAAQLTQQGNFYKATTNVAVKTGKPYGFDLTMKADGNGDLVNTVDPGHRISNMQNDSGYRGIEGIPANSWGYYMYDWHHNITVRPVYGHVPTAKDGERTLLGVTAVEQKGCSANHSNCAKDVVFVANIDPSKLASGSYSASITYTATTRPKPAPTVDPTTCKSGDPQNDCQVDLDSNMIPVKYTGSTTNAQWTSLANPEDSSNQGNWYNYNQKQWANAITVKDPSKYKNQTKVVEQADILGFWVYIPRYAYEVMRRETTDRSVESQNFLISFEKASTPKRRPAACPEKDKDYRTECDLDRSYIKGRPSNAGTWATHPAFTFGKKELNGIWFAKFETTGSIAHLTVLPNEAHVFDPALDSVGRMYTAAKTFGVVDSSNVGGKTDYVIPAQNSHHLSKFSSRMVNNNDWGAATYLSASEYGAGDYGVQINANGTVHNDSYGATGCGPWEDGDVDNYSDDSYSWTYHKGVKAGSLGTQQACSIDNPQRAYNGTLGQLASTTNNPTGIYDMSGGAWEYVAASYTGSSSTPSDEYFGHPAYSPYFNSYTFFEPEQCTFATCGGQALYETNANYSQWNGQGGSFIMESDPWFMRGGTYRYVDAGVYNVYYGEGTAGGATFRVALAPTAQN